MSLYNGPARGGNRGGKDQFNWDDVKNAGDREFYLGHSVKASTGRWQKGKDILWYTREKKGDQEQQLADELKAIKEKEEDLMAEAMGLKPKVRAAPKAAPTGQELQLLMRKARGESAIEEGPPAEAAPDAMPGLGFSGADVDVMDSKPAGTLHEVMAGTGMNKPPADVDMPHQTDDGRRLTADELAILEAAEKTATKRAKKAGKKAKKLAKAVRRDEKRRLKHDSRATHEPRGPGQSSQGALPMPPAVRRPGEESQGGHPPQHHQHRQHQHQQQQQDRHGKHHGTRDDLQPRQQQRQQHTAGYRILEQRDGRHNPGRAEDSPQHDNRRDDSESLRVRRGSGSDCRQKSGEPALDNKPALDRHMDAQRLDHNGAGRRDEAGSGGLDGAEASRHGGGDESREHDSNRRSGQTSDSHRHASDSRRGDKRGRSPADRGRKRYGATRDADEPRRNADRNEHGHLRGNGRYVQRSLSPALRTRKDSRKRERHDSDSD